MKSIKKGKIPYLGNKKTIIPIFSVSILWFLYGRSDGIRTHGLLVPNQARYQLRYTSMLLVNVVLS